MKGKIVTLHYNKKNSSDSTSIQIGLSGNQLEPKWRPCEVWEKIMQSQWKYLYKGKFRIFSMQVSQFSWFSVIFPQTDCHLKFTRMNNNGLFFEYPEEIFFSSPKHKVLPRFIIHQQFFLLFSHFTTFQYLNHLNLMCLQLFKYFFSFQEKVLSFKLQFISKVIYCIILSMN